MRYYFFILFFFLTIFAFTFPLPVFAKPEIHTLPIYIMGKGIINQKTMTDFLLFHNPLADVDFVNDLSVMYIEEADIEGVNHDVAFAQMCLETGFLKYGNLVRADMNNFCGLGAISAEQPGLYFPDPRIGVRAHIQHLKGYATDSPLEQELVDPRYYFIRLGSSETIMGLAGTWALDLDYAKKIFLLLERLYEFASFYD